MVENVIIIGGGMSGLSAAVYLARASLKPLVLAGSPSGGQLSLTSDVENFPGFEAINGAELVNKIRQQAIKFGAKVTDENVKQIKVNKNKTFEVIADKSYITKTIIVATGAKAVWLNLPSEQRLRGKGVSACATCDGFFFRNKTVGVIGGGDTACEEALTLTKFANKVYLIHRKPSLRASTIMQQRVLNNQKIEVVFNAVVEEVIGDTRVEALKLKINNQSKTIKADGLFVAIGHKPDTDIVKGLIELDDKGYIKTIKNRSTSVPGIFASGDCQDPDYRQAITAAGTGVEAALDVEHYLET